MNGLVTTGATADPMAAAAAKGFELGGVLVSLSMVSRGRGFDDYDVINHPSLRRICVPHTVKRGERVNVYYGESSKEGAVWKGSPEETLIAFAAVAGQRLEPSRKRFVCSACGAGGADFRTPEVCHGCKRKGAFVLSI